MPSRRDTLSGIAIALAVSAAGCSSLSPPKTKADETLAAVSDGDSEIEAISYGHVASVGEIRESVRIEGYTISVTLTDDGVDSFTNALETSGALEDPAEYEMRLYVDGELKQSSNLGRKFVESVRDGTFDGEFIVQLESREEAEQLRDALDDGQ